MRDRKRWQAHWFSARFRAKQGLPASSWTSTGHVIGLGASAPVYYPAVGDMLGTECIVPVDTDVANALGAVVGQVRVSVEAHISQPVEGTLPRHGR